MQINKFKTKKKNTDAHKQPLLSHCRCCLDNNQPQPLLVLRCKSFVNSSAEKVGGSLYLS